MAKQDLFKSYVSTAAALVQQYDGSIPFNDFLKKYFAGHKKFGSRDRKYITHLCYCYYRLGYAGRQLPDEERLLLALLLCSNNEHPVLAALQPEWKAYYTLPAEEKLARTGYAFMTGEIFPWHEMLSKGIDAIAFPRSHLIQPDLFLRIRPGYEKKVLQKLDDAKIAYSHLTNDGIALPNLTKVDTLLQSDREVVVQDYSSQRIAELLNLVKAASGDLQPAINVWDCCAASGGKSILAKDILGNIRLTVSDVRASIMHNLQKRFERAGIDHYTSMVVDLTHPPATLTSETYDLIIADVPCTGSGTWGRTPEQLYFFTPDKTGHYATLQWQIVQTILPYIKPGGFLLYITCSVFQQENEDMVEFILGTTSLQLMQQEVFAGYDKKADTMFGVLFKIAL